MADTATVAPAPAPVPSAPASAAPTAVDAAAEAAALARMGALRTALSAALKGALAGTDFEVRCVWDKRGWRARRRVASVAPPIRFCARRSMRPLLTPLSPSSPLP